MTEGTAKVKTMDYKKASKSMQSLVDNKGNINLVIPLSAKNQYLVITIPKKAVDDKINELHAEGLDKSERTKEISKWLNDHKKAALDKYIETSSKNFNFTISVKGVVPTPVVPEKTKLKPVTGTFKFKIVSDAAEKKGKADFIVPVKVTYSGLTISIKMHVTKGDLSEIKYYKTKSELEQKAIDAAIEKGIPPKQNIGGGSAPIHSDIKKGVRDGLASAKLQTLSEAEVSGPSGTGKKSEATPTKTVPTTKIGVVTKEAAKDDVKFKTVSATMDLSNVGAGKLKISVNISEKELLVGDKEFNKTVDKIVDMAMTEAKKKGFKSDYKINKFNSINVKTEIKKSIGPALSDKRQELKKAKKKGKITY